MAHAPPPSAMEDDALRAVDDWCTLVVTCLASNCGFSLRLASQTDPEKHQTLVEVPASYWVGALDALEPLEEEQSVALCVLLEQFQRYGSVLNAQHGEASVQLAAATTGHVGVLAKVAQGGGVTPATLEPSPPPQAATDGGGLGSSPAAGGQPRWAAAELLAHADLARLLSGYGVAGNMFTVGFINALSRAQLARVMLASWPLMPRGAASKSRAVDCAVNCAVDCAALHDPCPPPHCRCCCRRRHRCPPAVVDLLKKRRQAARATNTARMHMV